MAAHTDDARDVLMQRIAELGPHVGALGCLYLAEAYGWLIAPGQQHGEPPPMTDAYARVRGSFDANHLALVDQARDVLWDAEHGTNGHRVVPCGDEK